MPFFPAPRETLSQEQYTALLEEWSNLWTNEYPPLGSSIENTVRSFALVKEAKTWRERTFGRCFRALTKGSKGNLRIGLTNGDEIKSFPIEAEEYTVNSLMNAAYKNKECREFLGSCKLIDPPMNTRADVELSHLLQEISDAVAQEGTNAFKEKYYPGIPDITVPDKLVKKIMIAMQRELDREAMRVGKMPAVFIELPIERQRALAERRRWWFAKFGITPRSWKTGRFSVWKVTEEEIEDYKTWITFNN